MAKDYKVLTFGEFPTAEEIQKIYDDGWILVSFVSSYMNSVYGYFKKRKVKERKR
ncbi:MAG: hypothetical protein KAX33_11235 [Candidatus Lokiarchaeota archaeon]|nr:hypothetical protein [Candidatus Lokiarchaeota archaeon]